VFNIKNVMTVVSWFCQNSGTGKRGHADRQVSMANLLRNIVLDCCKISNSVTEVTRITSQSDGLGEREVQW